MGEGDLGLLYLLIISLPYIVVGILLLFGLLLLTRKSRGAKIGGGIVFALTLFGVIGVPLLKALDQASLKKSFIADALLPDAIPMQDATVLVVAVGAPNCNEICPDMIAGGHASRVVEVSIRAGEQEEIYRKGAMDISSLSGRVWDDGRLGFDIEPVGADIDYVLFTENHWLAYHDPDSFLQFPENAYAGFFLFRVEDARAFDISESELVLRIYQSPQMEPWNFWFSPGQGVLTVPSDEEIGELIASRLQ